MRSELTPSESSERGEKRVRRAVRSEDVATIVPAVDDVIERSFELET